MNQSSASISQPERPPARRAPLFHPCVWLAVVSLGACSDRTGPPVEPDPLRFTTITVTGAATCGLTAEGVGYCWGSGAGGLLGTTTPPEQCAVGPCSTRPVRIESTVALTSVSSSSTYACGLDTGGAPYCWGSIFVNADGTHSFGPVPVALRGGASLTSISAGWSHICGVAVTHEAYCWGDFEGGRRGDPLIGFDTSYATFEPNVVGGGLQFAEVVAGGAGTCGLTTSGETYCWGSDYVGTLGDPAAPVQQECGLAFSPCVTAPVPVAGGHLFTALSGSYLHACGRTGSGELYCWGLNDAHQIGTVVEPAALCGDLLCVKQPALVFVDQVTFASVSAGGSSTCALDSDGAGYCWGENSFGQVGNGGGTAWAPVRVSGDRRFKAIAIAHDHACALSLDGEAFCWGENGLGQLGTGNREDSNVPLAVVSPVAQ